MNIEKENEAIQLLASNKSTREVSAITGLSQSAVSRLANRKKDAIKIQTERLIEVLPDIIGDIIRDIKTSTTLSKLLAGEIEIEEMPLLLGSETTIMTKFMDLNYKMKTDVLKALGVLPTHAPSIFIQNLFQSEGGSIISSRVLNILNGQVLPQELQSPSEGVVIDVAPMKEKADEGISDE